MTALFILVALNLGCWGVFIGVLVGVRIAAYMTPEHRTASMAETTLHRTRVWAPRSSARATKIGP